MASWTLTRFGARTTSCPLFLPTLFFSASRPEPTGTKGSRRLTLQSLTTSCVFHLYKANWLRSQPPPIDHFPYPNGVDRRCPTLPLPLPLPGFPPNHPARPRGLLRPRLRLWVLPLTLAPLPQPLLRLPRRPGLLRWLVADIPASAAFPFGFPRWRPADEEEEGCRRRWRGCCCWFQGMASAEDEGDSDLGRGGCFLFSYELVDVLPASGHSHPPTSKKSGILQRVGRVLVPAIYSGTFLFPAFLCLFGWKFCQCDQWPLFKSFIVVFFPSLWFILWMQQCFDLSD